MKFSFRRIASALVIVSVLSFGLSFIATGISICSNIKSCAAAVALSGLDFTKPQPQNPINNETSQTTKSVILPSNSNPTSFPFGLAEIQVISLYCLILGIAMLIVMEFMKPHFLRKFLKNHHYSH